MTVTSVDANDFARAGGALPDWMFAVVVTNIDEFLGYSGQLRCPEELRDTAILLCSRRMWEVYKSNNGLVQYLPDGEISYLPADILKPALPLIQRYKGIGACG